MSENPRIDELRRRVQRDPASIAFAALAEEYRRTGLFHDAIETCRLGLQRHPAYLSARVTLGRALLEIGEYDEAGEHLEQVVRVAPENLAAIRALAELHHRRGDTLAERVVEAAPKPLTQVSSKARSVQPPIPRISVPVTEEQAEPAARHANAIPRPAPPASSSAPSPEPAAQVPPPPSAAAEARPVLPDPSLPARPPGPTLTLIRPVAAPAIPVLNDLELFLAGIDRARQTLEAMRDPS